MSKTAADFLNELEKKALVPAGVLASLKSQVAKAKTPSSPAAIGKLLVDKGHLTATQAHQLLAAPAPARAARRIGRGQGDCIQAFSVQIRRGGTRTARRFAAAR